MVGRITFGNNSGMSEYNGEWGQWFTNFNGTYFVPKGEIRKKTVENGLKPTDRELLEEILAELKASRLVKEKSNCLFEQLSELNPTQKVWHLVCPCEKCSVRF